MTTLLLIIIALGTFLITVMGLSKIVLEGNVGKSAQARRLNQLLSPVPDSASRIAQLAQQVEISRHILPDFGPHLRWIRLEGHHATEQELIGYSILSAVGGAVMGTFAFGIPLGPLAGGTLGFYLPYYLVKGQAEDIRERFHRQLPELVQILAAEVAAGASLSIALERLSSSNSLAGAIFKQILATANAHGNLWSIHQRLGGLQVAAREWHSPALISLMTQLDTIHTQGIEGPETLAVLARAFAIRYLGEARMRAETLENKLLLPLALFFFAPFVGVILAPIMLMLINIF